jgi:hypothetical protein
MMYCPRCDKNVDFNSTAVSGPTRAYTLDLDGPIDPTIIRSSSKVVNVCRNCGNQNIFHSKAAYQANQKQVAEKHSEKGFHAMMINILGLGAGIFSAIYFLNGCGKGQELIAVFCGLGVGAVAWIIGRIAINLEYD